MIVLYIVYAIIGISIIIFLHELGHFLAAKKVGVRVERFSVGFDPPVRGKNLRFFSYKKGDTEYVIGMIPFGGYVKLAGGEYLADPDHEPRPDELPAKGVGARALVFAAGSLMNIGSSFVFFMIAFALGVTFYAPKIGLVEPSTPAWEGGLRPGDTVVGVDGKEVIDFTEMRLAVVLGSSSEPLSVQVERPTNGAGTTRVDLTVTPRFDPELGFNEIGAAPAYDEAIEEVVEGSAAERAGLRTGDRIRGIEIAGVRLPPMPVSLIYKAYSMFLSLRPAESIRFFVEREGAELAIAVAAEKDDKLPRPQLGVLHASGNVVRAIQPGSVAAGVLSAGDRVIAVDGERLATAFWLPILEKHGKKAEVELGIQPRTGPARQARVRLDDLLRWILSEEIAWDDFSSEVISVAADSPMARAGLQPGDVLIAVNGKPAYSHEQIEARDLGPTVEIQVLRAGNAVALSAERTGVLEWRGVAWRHMPVVGDVFRGGPADRAGIRPGDRILRLDKKDLGSWNEMTENITARKAGDGVAIAWRTPEGEVKEAQAVIGLDAWSLGVLLAVEEKVVRTGIAESVVMGAKRTGVSARQIFLTLKSLIRRDVSAKNLSGPVGITHLLTKVVEQGNLGTLIFYLALISINLGLFNLLPFPILDGGHLLFLFIEKLKGSPVDVRVQEMAMNIAFVCILFLAVFVTFNDLKRIF
jgi:regulator of sigma E protease